MTSEKRKKVRTVSTYIRLAAQTLATTLAWDAYKIPGLESSTELILTVRNGDEVVWSRTTSIRDFQEDDNERADEG